LLRNVFAGGRLLATYAGPGESTLKAGYHFHLTDWLGTQRMQTTVAGNQEEICYSYPFGDGLSCTGTDAAENHFTSKERDTEWGLDYFGARYLSSGLGRFLTPDWAAAPTAVPYAEYGDPQSLNLFAYVANNPNSGVDLGGHCGLTNNGCNEPPGMAPGGGPGSDPLGGGLSGPIGATGASNDFAEGEARIESYFGVGAPPPAPPKPKEPSPDPNLPINEDYVLAVENDSGPQMGQYGAREVEYDLHSAPDPAHPNGSRLKDDVTSTVITEHMSNTVDFTGSSSTITGQFTDNIGPHGCQIHGCTGTVTTDRYFTVVINGRQIGVVRVLDRNGTHTVDHISVDRTNDRTSLNGHTKEATDVPN